jgi:hypothetical protein
LKQKTNKASRGCCRKQNKKPIQKEKQQTFDEPSFPIARHCCLLPAIIIMFLSRRSNCLWLLVILVIPSFTLTLSCQKTKVLWTIKKYLCRSSLSLSLSLSLSACVQLSTPKSKETQMEPCVTKESYPKIQGNPNGTLCHKRELSVKSPCFHLVFGPGFTPYLLFQWYLQSKGNFSSSTLMWQISLLCVHNKSDTLKFQSYTITNNPKKALNPKP